MKELSKKDLIMKTAAEMFHTQGYNATTMRDLARKVGIEAPSLYSHIRSKEELLIHLCFANARQFISGIEEAEKMNGDSISKIEQLIRHHISIALKEGTSVTVFDDQWKNLSEPHLSSFLEIRKDYERRFAKLIAEGIKNKQISDLNPTVLMNTMISSLRWIHINPAALQLQGESSLYDQITKMLLNGIKNHGGR